MREREMRQRIERFLQTRLRRMLAPATLGLGLAMTGCPSSALDATDDGGALVKDAEADQAPAMKYLAQIPDAGKEVPAAVPDYMTPAPKHDAGPVLRYGAQTFDAGPDIGEAVGIYLAQLPVSSS